MSPRYAIYFAPPKASPWWAFAAQWLGRNEFDDAPLTIPQTLQFAPDELLAITAEPRRYGFHATLKAPFRLSDKCSVDDLIARTQALANTLTPISLGPLQALSLGKFVALVPEKTPDELAALAAACVVDLDDLRAPLSDQYLARRQSGQLDAREMALLHRYGYPYVLERFRFHFTLTGPVDPPAQQRVVQAVQAQVAHLNTAAPLVLDRLCLFVEPTPGASFRRMADVALSA
jgi:putative phosphonate metabolism protein